MHTLPHSTMNRRLCAAVSLLRRACRSMNADALLMRQTSMMMRKSIFAVVLLRRIAVRSLETNSSRNTAHMYCS
jgi:hypothetical protein